jgi:MoxR-like ATPase
MLPVVLKMGAPLGSRVRRVFAALRSGLVEREDALWLSLLAALAGEHFLLIGPPGTAKSTLARRLHLAFRGRYFERLLTRFSVPEEIFGPLSLKGLERDVYERLTDGYLPTASIAFLDEIFKANSAILNALLGVLNERVIDQGPRRDPVPLVSLVAASNELPDTEELAALSDRFILRYEVGPVSANGFADLVRAEDTCEPLPDHLAFDAEELRSVRAAARAIAVPPWVVEFVGDLRAKLAGKGIYVSDRRWRKSFDILRVSALVDDRAEVGLPDLNLFRHSLWQKPEQRAPIEETLRAAVIESFLAEPERYEALVETLEHTLKDELAAETHLQDQRGALFVDQAGKETHRASVRRQKKNSLGEPLFVPPPGMACVVCTADQLRERLRDGEVDRYIANPLNWMTEDVPNAQRLGRKRYQRSHVATRVEQVARVRRHLDEFLAGMENVLASHDSGEGVFAELGAIRERLDKLRERLEALRAGFQSLPVHDVDDERAS